MLECCVELTKTMTLSNSSPNLYVIYLVYERFLSLTVKVKLVSNRLNNKKQKQLFGSFKL